MISVYVNPDSSGQARASALGCGWLTQVPPGVSAPVPCVILSGAGQTSILPDDGTLTAAAVSAAGAPIAQAEAANAATAATQATNQSTIRQQALTALTNNQAYLAIASPTTAQAVAQVRSLTQQMDGVIRLLLGQLDATS